MADFFNGTCIALRGNTNIEEWAPMDRPSNFIFLLKDVSRLESMNFERHLKRVGLGLTLEQCLVLITLQRNQGINQTRLAHLLNFDPMKLVRILDRMENDKWLERRPYPQDRRVKCLFLNFSALLVAQKIWTICDLAHQESSTGFDTTEQAQLMDLLTKVYCSLASGKAPPRY